MWFIQQRAERRNSLEKPRKRIVDPKIRDTKEKPVWKCKELTDQTFQTMTKSEARAKFKYYLGYKKRLPVGVKIERV